jgi:hypothetical protein
MDQIEHWGIHLKREGMEYIGPCPLCGGTDRFAVNTEKELWLCRGCGVGGDVIDLVRHLDDCDFIAACTHLAGEAPAGKTNGQYRGAAIAGEYSYRDENGNLLFQVVRFAPKGFRQRRREGGAWVWNLKGVRRVLYNLPAVIAAVKRGVTIHIVEGEKDADALRQIGLIATTNPNGAGKWRSEYNEVLRDADVVLIGDNDDAGRDHVNDVGHALVGIAKRIRVLDLAGHWPQCPQSGDVSDFIKAGGTAEQLATWVAAAPKWKQATAASPTAGDDWPEPKALLNELAPVDAFDSSFLPDRLAPWVDDITNRLQCPGDYVGVSATVALSATYGRRIAIAPQQKTDWYEVPNLWGAFVGPPGMLKSPAMNEALKPLRYLEAEAAKAYEIDLEAFNAGIDEFKLRMEVKKALQKKHLKKAAGSDASGDEKPFKFELGDEPEEPVAVRYRTNDTSYEKLGELLVDNPSGLLVERDELISLLRHLDRDDQANARGFFLSGWSGTQPYTFDRITRGHKHVQAVCVSILGNTQPSRIAEYVRRANADGGGGDGLIQRFNLLVWPDACPDWHNVDQYPDSRARDTAREVFKQASELTLDEAIKRGATKTVDDPVPFFRFDETALGTFLEWRTDLEARLRRAEMSAAMEGHLAKYRKLVPALALINHIADGGTKAVSNGALLKALAFARYLESHARRVYGAHNTIEIAAGKAILAHIRNGDLKDSFTARDVHQRDWSGLTDREHVQRGLDLLIELGHLAAVPSAVGERGGRRTTSYEINPRVLA